MTDGEDNDDDTGPPAPPPSGAKGGAILGQAPRGLHGVAAIAATPAPGSPDSATKRAAAAATAALPMEGRGQGRRGSVRSPPRPSGPPRSYGSPTDGAGRKASPTRSSPQGVPPGAGEGGGGGGAGGRLLRRFRTKVGGRGWGGDVRGALGLKCYTCLPTAVGIFCRLSGLWLSLSTGTF